MKRSLLVFTCGICLLFCSCKSGKTAVTPLVRGISFCAAVTYYNETYACDVVIEKGGKSTLRFTEPAALADLAFVCEDQTLTAEYAGLRHQWSRTDHLSYAAAEILFEIFSDADKADRAVLKDKNYTVTNTVEGISYTLSLGATGLPISLAVDEKGFYADFQNVTIL